MSVVADHIILVGAFIDPGSFGEPLLEVRCSCGVILLQSGDDEMVTLYEIQQDAKKHLAAVILLDQIEEADETSLREEDESIQTEPPTGI